jgi:hypothetical protein
MPELKNRKHEAFARALFEGLANDNAAWKAYVRAGYTKHERSTRADSARLMRMAPEIIARVQEFQREAAKQAQETAETIVAELNDVAAEAKQDRAHQARTGAIGLKAKILGIQIDRVEQGKPGEFNPANAQSPDEFARAYLASGCNVAHDSISEDQIDATKAELERHHAAIEAIARMPMAPPASASAEARRAAVWPSPRVQPEPPGFISGV